MDFRSMNKEETDSVLERATTLTASATTSSEEIAKPGKRTSKHAVRYAKVYGFFGFQRWYNFPLWVIFGGGIFGFVLSRLADYDFYGFFKDESLTKGYWYYYHTGKFRVGIILHLAAILPAGIFMVLQFVPRIRHKWILFHRINGYLIILLVLVSNAGTCIVIPHQGGGGARISAQSAEAFLVLITTIGLGMAWWNIRCKQIDQHRAWMLRTMIYPGSIVTNRILESAAAPIISRLGTYYGVWTCDELDFMYTNLNQSFPATRYSSCMLPNGQVNGSFSVAVNAREIASEPERLGLAITMPFGSNLWICAALHIIGVEIYLGLTPRESERLRQVSYEKQLEAGFKHPGSAGLTADRWGDADKWTPSK